MRIGNGSKVYVIVVGALPLHLPSGLVLDLNNCVGSKVCLEGGGVIRLLDQIKLNLFLVLVLGRFLTT